MKHHSNADYIHHNETPVLRYMRDVVFGVQDGMVSTLGALTGIAVGSESQFVVVLAGLVVIAVESISMGIGSYTSSLSEQQIIDRKLFEEKMDIAYFPKEERQELLGIYRADGWPETLAEEMARVAAADKNLMLKEMAYHELDAAGTEKTKPAFGGLWMFVSYVIGGFIPLSSYFFFPIEQALIASVGVTLVGLFMLGVGTSRFTKQHWVRAGLHLLFFGGIALAVGYTVGLVVK